MHTGNPKPPCSPIEPAILRRICVLTRAPTNGSAQTCISSSQTELRGRRSAVAEPDDLTSLALEAQVQRAEDLYRRGEYGIALDAYLKLLADRLSSGLGLVEHLGAADLVVIDRLADLSALFGMFDAADDLISAIVALTRKVGNDVAADYCQLKRVELNIRMRALHPAFEGLRELETRIGDLLAIDMSLAGFERWEKQTAWHDLPAGDREVQFSRIYYIFVRLLAARGQYQQAICAAERSEVYTG